MEKMSQNLKKATGKDMVEWGEVAKAGGCNGMVSHLVKIGGVDEVDEEVIGWLRKAYEGA